MENQCLFLESISERKNMKLSVNFYRGALNLQIRYYNENDHPTKKGVSLDIEECQTLRNLLNSRRLTETMTSSSSQTNTPPDFPVSEKTVAATTTTTTTHETQLCGARPQRTHKRGKSDDADVTIAHEKYRKQTPAPK